MQPERLRSWRNVRLVIGVTTILVASARPARADGEDAAAEALFLQAREAMAKGDYAKACPMLEESHRLVPGVGTKFNLGDCYEHLGRTASAWASFRDAAATSKLAGQRERENAATERASRLTEKLCRLTIRVEPQPGVTVTRDGDPVGSGQWGIALPVDPGAHVVEAKANGRRTWTTTVSFAACPREEGTTVPLLPVESSPAPLLATSDVPAPRTSPTRTVVTVGSLGLGVVGLGLGTFFGLRAMSLRDQSNDGPCSGNTCTLEGRGLRADSREAGTAATISFIAGGALLALGTILWLTDAPKPKPR